MLLKLGPYGKRSFNDKQVEVNRPRLNFKMKMGHERGIGERIFIENTRLRTTQKRPMWARFIIFLMIILPCLKKKKLE